MTRYPTFGMPDLRNLLGGAIVILGVMLAAVFGTISIAFPLIGLVLVIPMALAWTIAHPYFRLIVVLFGGLSVLQSSTGLGATKLLYLFACLLIVCLASLRLPMLRDPGALYIGRVFLISSAIWTFVVLYTLPLAHVRGTDMMNWLRDSVPYLLLAVVPLLAMDVATSLQVNPFSPTPQRIVVAYGILSTVGFTAHWLSQRGIVEIPLGGFLFSTMTVPAMLYCYALSKAFHGNNRKAAWTLLAVFVAVMIAGTGTRTSVLLFTMPLVVLVFQRGISIGRLIANSLAFIVLGITTVATLAFVGATYLTVDLDSIINRFKSIGDITGNSGAGQSFMERSTVTDLSWEAFYSSPVSGLGPGHVYEWEVPYSNDLQSAFILDSPFALFAKFGVLGFVAFAGTVIALWALQRQLFRRSPNGKSVAGSTVQCFLAVTLLFSVLGSPVDDKGFSFSVLLVLIVGLQELIIGTYKDAHHESTRFSPDALVQSGPVARRQPDIRGTANL